MNENDRAIVGFTTFSHSLVHTYELSIPILMTIWLVEFSVDPATLGTIVAVGYGLMGFGALPSGILTDAYGSRTIIVGCLAGMGTSFLLLSVAPSLPLIAVALCLWGAAASLYHPAGLSLISKGVTVRGRAFGYHGMGGNAGIALGPLVAALLLVAFDWEVVAGVLAVPALLAALYGLRRDFDETAAVATEAKSGSEDSGLRSDGGSGDGPSTGNGSSNTRSGVTIPSVTDVRTLFTVGFSLVFLLVMFNGLYYRGLLTFLPEILGEFLRAGGVSIPIPGPEGAAGAEFELGRYLYSGLLMVGIAGQYVGGRLVDRLPLEWSFAAILGVLAVISVAFVPVATVGPIPLIALSVILGFTMFSVQPISQAIVAAYSPSDVRGLSYGFTYLAIFGVGALGAAISGVALTFGSVTAMFLVLAAIAMVGFGTCLVLIRIGSGQRNAGMAS